MVKSTPDSVAAFLRPARSDKSGELLVIPGWRQADWEALFSYAQLVHVGRGRVLIRKQASERALFFLASGLSKSPRCWEAIVSERSRKFTPAPWSESSRFWTACPDQRRSGL